MKLTIKKTKYHQGKKKQFDKYEKDKSVSKCCSSDDQTYRHVFFRPPNKKQKLLYDLIKVDSVTAYTKIDPKINIFDLNQTIAKTLSQFQLKYQPWIGYLCAHLCSHYGSPVVRIGKIGLFVNKFRAAFQQIKCAQTILQQTMIRLQKYCLQISLKPTQKSLALISNLYQKTLLLQFLPVQYSQYIIDRYLANDGDIQQYIRICTSLIHFVLNTCNPVSEDHFVSISKRPYMGTVQWPIIIANRTMFQSQPVYSPLIQHTI